MRIAIALLSVLLLTLLSFSVPSFADETGDAGEAHVQAMTNALIGTPAPRRAVQLMNGDNVDLGSLVGKKPVYLKFWATWCLPCRQQMPHFQSAFEKYGDEIQFLSVNAGLNDSVESVTAFQEKYALTMPLAIDTDGAVGRAFKLTVTPQHILIDRSGTIRYIGHLASDELDQALAAVLDDERATPTPTTPKTTPSAEAAPKSLDLLDGSTFELENSDSRPTVLFFFAAWCDWYLAETRPEVSSRCIAFQEAVRDLHKQYGEQVRVVGIAQSLWTNADYLREYQARLDVQYPIGLDLDSTWFANYGVRDVPTIVVLDGKHAVVSTIVDDADALDAALTAVVAE